MAGKLKKYLILFNRKLKKNLIYYTLVIYTWLVHVIKSQENYTDRSVEHIMPYLGREPILILSMCRNSSVA